MDLVQDLSERGLSEVPPRFLQPPGQRPPSSPGKEILNVPVIDFKNVLQQQAAATSILTSVADDVTSACEEWGFFQVVNHGIDVPLLEKVKNVVNEFLHLPREEKLKCPIKFEPYHPKGSEVLDWVDGLIHYLAPPDLKDPEYWPDKPSDYRETIERYGAQVQMLVKLILGILSCKLDLSKHHLEEAFGGERMQVIWRVNNYPKCPQADLVMGLSPHSDGSAITVLLQDEVEGLQVNRDGKWWTVKPVPGALIVNMGDMMQLISNGRYTSMEHRAVVSKERDRVSHVLFFLPWVDAVIAPFGTGSQSPLYRPTRYGDYLATYADKELSGKDRINSLLIRP